MANKHPKIFNRCGVPNKATRGLREFALTTWQSYMSGDNGMASFFDDFAKLRPKERVHYMIKLAEFIAPKMSATTVSVAAGEAEASAITLRLQQMCAVSSIGSIKDANNG